MRANPVPWKKPVAAGSGRSGERGTRDCKCGEPLDDGVRVPLRYRATYAQLIIDWTVALWLVVLTGCEGQSSAEIAAEHARWDRLDAIYEDDYSEYMSRVDKRLTQSQPKWLKMLVCDLADSDSQDELPADLLDVGGFNLLLAAGSQVDPDQLAGRWAGSQYVYSPQGDGRKLVLSWNADRYELVSHSPIVEGLPSGVAQAPTAIVMEVVEDIDFPYQFGAILATIPCESSASTKLIRTLRDYATASELPTLILVACETNRAAAEGPSASAYAPFEFPEDDQIREFSLKVGGSDLHAPSAPRIFTAGPAVNWRLMAQPRGGDLPLSFPTPLLLTPEP